MERSLRPPNTPAWVSVWGDTLNARIQIDGYDLIPLPVFLEAAKLTLPEELKQVIDPGQTIEAAEPKALTPAELHKLYASLSVPQHRYLASAVAAAIKVPTAPTLAARLRASPVWICPAWSARCWAPARTPSSSNWNASGSIRIPAS